MKSDIVLDVYSNFLKCVCSNEWMVRRGKAGGIEVCNKCNEKCRPVKVKIFKKNNKVLRGETND